MSTRPLQLTDENLPPRKRQRNFMNYDSNYINNSFTKPENEIYKSEINNSNNNIPNSEYKCNFEFDFNFTKNSLNKAKSEETKEMDNNVDKNIKEEEKNEVIKIEDDSSSSDVEIINASQNLNSDDQIDIIGNASEEEEESENGNSESEEEMEREEIHEFDEETKEKMRSEAHELGILN